MTPINLSFGVEGLRQSDYRVYLADVNEIFGNPDLGEILSDFLSYKALDKRDTSTLLDVPPLITNILSEMTPVGELRQDSIVLTGDNGNSIAGNESGEIPLGKKCTFEAELINSTVENIDTLTSADGVACFIVLEEIVNKSFTFPGVGPQEHVMMKRYIMIGQTNPTETDAYSLCRILRVNNKTTGGDVPRLIFSVSDNVAEISDFRLLDDVIFDAVLFDNHGHVIEAMSMQFDSDTLMLNPGTSTLELSAGTIEAGFDEDDIEVETYVVTSAGIRLATGAVTASYDSGLALEIVCEELPVGDTLDEAHSFVKFRLKPTATTEGLYSAWVTLPVAQT